MDLFYPQTKLGPTVPTLWGTLFTDTMCHRYLSGLITTAHNCLLKRHNTSVPELLPSAGMPILGCQHYLVELTALPPQDTQSVPFRWLDWCQSCAPDTPPMQSPCFQGWAHNSGDTTWPRLRWKMGLWSKSCQSASLGLVRSPLEVNVCLLQSPSWQGGHQELQMSSVCPCAEGLPENNANPEKCKAKIWRK